MWDELTAEDAGRAFQAIQALSNSGAEAVAFIRGNLRPMKEKLGERINSLLVQLDARSFAKRDAAMRQLTEIGPEAAPELEKLLNGKPTLDLKNRVEELLKRSQMAPVGDRLRGVRAVEVLSRISTPAARQALTELADGAPDAWLTREARAAMERLGK
jgi:hypothetical protein